MRVAFLAIIMISSIFYSGIRAIPLDGRAFSVTPSTKSLYCNQESSENICSSMSSRKFEPIKVLCDINGHIVSAIIDTGAQISIMSRKCAQKCNIYQMLNTEYSGRAIGVGSSDIVGKIESVAMRIGPVSFNGDFSVLKDGQVDLLLGLDFLDRFHCDINLRESYLRLYVRENLIRVPLQNRVASRYPLSTAFQDDSSFESRLDIDISSDDGFFQANSEQNDGKHSYDYFYEDSVDDSSVDQRRRSFFQLPSFLSRKHAIKQKEKESIDSDSQEEFDDCLNWDSFDDTNPSDPISLEGV